MKYLYSIFVFFSLVATSYAQFLVKDDVWTFEQIGEGYYDVEPSVIYQNRFGITGQNYVKGRNLSELWFRGAGLNRPKEVEGLELSFYEKTDFGYYGVFDEKDYNIVAPKTVLVIYNADKIVTNQYLLSDALAEGRVCDFRYDNGLFFVALGNEGKKTEFGYFSYQLYCFDIKADQIVWRTDYEVCSKQFEVIKDYVISGFGGTRIDDYVCLIDRGTGVTLDRSKVPSEPQYIEATRTQDTIYVVDYNSVIHRYLISDRCVRVTGRGVRLRRGASTTDEIFSDSKGRPIYPATGDNLAYLGESGDFYKVRYMQQELFISKRFSELHVGVPEKQQLVSLWQKEMSDSGDAIAAPVRTMYLDIDGDGIEERICKDDNDNVAVFTARNKEYSLILSDIMNNLHVYPNKGMIRTCVGLSSGYESEVIYLLENSKLKETYKCENDVCTKVIGQSEPISIRTKDFESIRLLLNKAKEEDFSTSFDL